MQAKIRQPPRKLTGGKFGAQEGRTRVTLVRKCPEQRSNWHRVPETDRRNQKPKGEDRTAGELG